MSYAGDVSPEDAYAALQDDADAVLVDVRTAAEWAYVGLPDLSGLGKQVVTIEWQSFPSGAHNGAFLGQLRDCGIAEDTRSTSSAGPASGRPPPRSWRPRTVSARHTTSGTGSRGRTTGWATAASRGGRPPVCRGGRDDPGR